MRKTFLFSIAMLISGSAFAIDSNTTFVTFSPESGSVLTNLSQQITLSFDKSDLPQEATKVVINQSGGMGFEQSSGFNETIEITKLKDYVLTLNPEAWSEYNNGKRILDVSVVLADSDGELLMGDDGDYVLNMAGYEFMAPSADVFVNFYPNNDTWTVDKVPFNLFYTKTNGFCSMTFKEKVTIVGTLGTVQYFDPDGYELEGTLTITDYQQYLDETDGLYNVTFRIRNWDYTPSEIGKMVVTITGIQGVEFGDKNPFTINNPTYFPSKNNAPNKTKDIVSGLAVSSAPVAVYNTQGMLVKGNASQNDINSLTPGLYIVNGKKIVVK